MKKETGEENPSISVILVIPKNLQVCRYWINGGKETRARKRESLVNFITELAPTLSAKVAEMTYKNLDTSFIVTLGEVPELIPLKKSIDWNTATARIQEKMQLNLRERGNSGEDPSGEVMNSFFFHQRKEMRDFLGQKRW